MPVTALVGIDHHARFAGHVAAAGRRVAALGLLDLVVAWRQMGSASASLAGGRLGGRVFDTRTRDPALGLQAEAGGREPVILDRGVSYIRA